MAEGEHDRTEAATPRRIIRAREEGSVAFSRELPMLAGLAAATLVLATAGPSLCEALLGQLAGVLEHAGSLTLADRGSATLAPALAMILRAIAPIAGAALLGGVGVAILQTGFLFHPQAIAPDPGRLAPGRWLRRIASPEGLFEQAKSLAKLAVIGLAIWHVLAGDLPTIAESADRSPVAIVLGARKELLAVLTPVLAALAGIALLDLLWVRLRHTRGLRMSREEVRQELKETEGDPHIKARIRQIRGARAKRRMLGAVKKATVVVTNPTHYAVALAYERGKNAAPRVVAKGVDTMAARIRELAIEHRVPVVANPPLARALYQVEIDTEIAPEHYKAVAEIIAYVWRLGATAARSASQASRIVGGG